MCVCVCVCVWAGCLSPRARRKDSSGLSLFLPADMSDVMRAGVNATWGEKGL